MARRRSVDPVIFFTALVLLGIGVVMVFSASSVKAHVVYGDSYYYLKRQLMWVVAGVGAMVLMARYDYQRLRERSRLLMVLGIVLLIAVLIPGIGRAAGGARRWIGYGAYTFNPSEFTKLATVVYMAATLSRRRPHLADFWKGVAPHLVLGGILFLLILAQPDLGTAVSIVGTIFIMLFAAGVRVRHLAGLSVLGVPVLLLAVFSEEYRRRRFLAFLNPWEDPRGAGFHIIQSLYALGSGGLFGLGLGRSRQKFFYLPGLHTDFIFAVLGEELGFLGAATVLALFFLLAWRGYKVALTAPDSFGNLLAVGVTSMIALQVIVNIGVVTGVLPITGIPLPLISFGGSSLVFTLAGLGILLNVSMYAAY